MAIRDMRTITISERSRAHTLHVEAPGCIINIHVGLTDAAGRQVTSVSISADGNRYAGEPAWWIETDDGTTDGMNVRVVREPAKAEAA